MRAKKVPVEGQLRVKQARNSTKRLDRFERGVNLQVKAPFSSLVERILPKMVRIKEPSAL